MLYLGVDSYALLTRLPVIPLFLVTLLTRLPLTWPCGLIRSTCMLKARRQHSS